MGGDYTGGGEPAAGSRIFFFGAPQEDSVLPLEDSLCLRSVLKTLKQSCVPRKPIKETCVQRLEVHLKTHALRVNYLRS